MFESFKAHTLTAHEKITKITEGTPYQNYEAVPDHNIFEDIRGESRPPQFWGNFKAVNPVMMNHAFGKDTELAEMRDKCVTEEILKCKVVIEGLHKEF